jgi:hypothetical protein
VGISADCLYDTPSSLYDTPSGLYETPSGLCETPSGLYDIPSGLYGTPSGLSQEGRGRRANKVTSEVSKIRVQYQLQLKLYIKIVPDSSEHEYKCTPPFKRTKLS